MTETRRTRPATTWFTPEEDGKVRAAAKKAGAPLSAILRDGALAEARRIVPDGVGAEILMPQL